MNAFLVALLASAVVLVSARTTERNQQKTGLSARLLTPDEQTLKLLLSTPEGSIGGGNSQVPVGQLVYNLNRDYEQRINPRNPNSDFKFLSVKNGKYIADNVAIIRDGISAAEFVTVPFAKFVSPQEEGLHSILSGYEGVLVNKIKFVVEPEHKLTVRAAFSVKIKNVEDQPFGKNAVTNVTDDPSLATAGFGIASSGKHGLAFSIVATNNGIWAVYERNRVSVVEHPEYNDKLFTIFHRLADRQSHTEEIDAAITYVRSENLVHFKLNNVIVYTIKNLGTLPKNEPGTLYHTTTREDLVRVEPKEFTVFVGIVSYLDAQDPNNQAHSHSNQRLTNEDVYDVKAKFADETGNKTFNLWGQGAILKLHDIVIQLQESHGREDTNELKGRKGERLNEQVDGKLIVPHHSADLEELTLINGERVPRIDNKQEGEDEEFSAPLRQDDDTATVQEEDDSVNKNTRVGRQDDESNKNARIRRAGGKFSSERRQQEQQ